MKVKFQVAMIVALMAGAGVLTACSKSDEQQAAAAQQQAPKATVDIQTIQLQPVPIIQTFAGRVAAVETSEVRPQVTGIIDEVMFREGAIVQAGQPLYRINIDSYTSAIESARAAIASAEASVNNAKASRASAQANLQSQEANLAQARADLSRYKELIEVEAVSRQVYDQAITAVRTAEANVAAARAAVQQAEAIIQSSQSAVRNAQASLSASELDVGRTIVRAPITGRIGISNVTAGALVSANQSQSMVTINRLDEVYVDISQSSTDMLRLREAVESGRAGAGSLEVQLQLEDGTIYPDIGRLLLANAQVDEATGAMTLRAVFPNQSGKLVPGMFVNARLIQSVVPSAALLPQSAITRTPKGETQVFVVNSQNKIEVRTVTTAGTYNGNWIVTGGINNGDRVVIIGGTKVKADQEVDVRELPATTNEANANTGGEPSAQGQQAPAQNQQAPEQQAAVPMARPAEKDQADTAEDKTEAQKAN